MSNSRKRFITIAGMLWGIVMALSVNTGSLTNAVDFTIPTTISLNETTLNIPGSKVGWVKRSAPNKKW